MKILKFSYLFLFHYLTLSVSLISNSAENAVIYGDHVTLVFIQQLKQILEVIKCFLNSHNSTHVNFN